MWEHSGILFDLLPFLFFRCIAEEKSYLQPLPPLVSYCGLCFSSVTY